jgi:hypothetical protein
MGTTHCTTEPARRTPYDPQNCFSFLLIDLFMVFSLFVIKSVSDVKDFIHGLSAAFLMPTMSRKAETVLNQLNLRPMLLPESCTSYLLRLEAPCL